MYLKLVRLIFVALLAFAGLSETSKSMSKLFALVCRR